MMGSGSRHSEASMDEIPALLPDMESDRTERTESLNDAGKLCRAICAFANDMPGHGKPGYLFIGVDKEGRPTGAQIDEHLLESLASHRSNGQIIPMPAMSVYKHTHDGVDIAVVAVQPSDMPPVRYKEVVWIRVGPSQRRATAEEERRLNERRVDRAATWDLQACRDASIDDLSIDTFKLSYLPRAVSAETIEENSRAIEVQLASLRLWHPKFQCPTNAAVVVLGNDPQRFVPAAYVQYVAYDGMSQSDAVLEERRLSGDLLTVLRGLDELARSLGRVRPLRDPTMREQDVADYPPLALRELFINAVIHRNYEGSTTPVTIDAYRDRVEIQNPGSLYGDLTRAQFPHGVSYRNPVLAEAAKILGFANRFGRGIDIAQAELTKNGSPPLEYVIGDNHMLMIVRTRP